MPRECLSNRSLVSLSRTARLTRIQSRECRDDVPVSPRSLGSQSHLRIHGLGVIQSTRSHGSPRSVDPNETSRYAFRKKVKPGKSVFDRPTPEHCQGEDGSHFSGWPSQPHRPCGKTWENLGAATAVCSKQITRLRLPQVQTGDIHIGWMGEKFHQRVC